MLLKILFFKLIFHYIHPNFTSAQNTLKFKSFDSWNHASYQTSDYRKTFKGIGKCRYIFYYT